MTDGIILSTYGSHNAGIAMYDGKEYHVVELERWLNKKNAGLSGYLPAKYPQKVFDDILEYLFDRAGTQNIKLFLSNYLTKIDLSKYEIGLFKRFDHHAAHASCAYYQSPYQKAITFTYDGGGNGSFFNVYKSENRSVPPTLIDRFDIDLGFPYMILADHMEDIRRDPLNIGNLVYAGKFMGLCAYGTVNEKWLPHFEEFYKKFRYGGKSFTGGAEKRIEATTELFSAIGVDMSTFSIENTRFEGQFSWDIAATSQRAFENIFLELITPYMKEHPDYPICLSGGCALNVILNLRLTELYPNREFYIPPNVNDCGIAVGGLLEHTRPKEQIDLTYSGLPIMDEINFTSLVESNPVELIENTTVNDIGKLLANNYIIGVIQGNSEHGPRALGNRSILCAPTGDMKDILNKKVKDREWYRPFAPVVRVEDTEKYFEFASESRHMSFIAKVRPEHDLPAITHVDRTGRLQTVSKDQNELLYNIITDFNKKTGCGVILNTSFNVNGKPILTRLSDAFEILLNTELDCIYYDKKIIFKHRRKNEFEALLRETTVLKSHTNYTVYVSAYTENDSEFESFKENIKEIEQNHTKVMVILNKKHTDKINLLKTTKVFPIDHYKIFYKDMIESAGYKGKEIDFIKPLWIKDIINDNELDSDFHVVIALDENNSLYNFNKFFNKYMTEDSLVDKIIIESDPDTSNISIWDFLALNSAFNEADTTFPSFGIYAGYTENILWFLRTYEGNFRYHMLTGRGKTNRDYLSIEFLENEDKILIMG